MKSICALLLGLLVASPALAQDPDKDALKRDLLKEVEKRLKSEEERLLKDIEKVIDEELNKSGKAPKTAPKVESPKAEAPKAEAPKRKARGYMGIRLVELTDEDKKDLGVKSGLKVAEAVEGGPAAKAGLDADDVILSVDGRAIDSMQELAPIMQAAGAGTTVKIEYLRAGKKKTANVVLAPHPADAQPAEPPKEQGKGEQDLRERVKKFLEKKDAPKDETPAKPKAKGKPAPAPKEDGDDLFAFDEETFDQFKEMFEKFGVSPDQFFEKGKDGRYHLTDEMKEMFKNFNFDRFKDLLPKGQEPEEEPAPKKPEPRKATPKKAEPKVLRPWLGVQPEELPDELRAQLDLPEGTGLLVTEVVPGGPAAAAGLKKNDILLKIDGQAVKGEDSLAKFMAAAKPGQEAKITVLRKSKEQTLTVTIGEK